MPFYFLAILAGLLFFGSASTARAVPPPDFIFNIGSSVVQVFSFLAVAFSALAGILVRFYKTHPLFVRHRRIVVVGIVILLIVLPLAGTYLYRLLKQGS